MPLAGKHIVVTGARGALGSVLADRALEMGARLTLVDLAAARPGPEERWVAVDLTDRAATRRAFADAEPADCLFHVAGGFAMGSLASDDDPAEWEQMFRINVTTLRNVLAQVVPPMRARRSGAIVTVGAMSALKGAAGMSAYAAAKAAVHRLTESLADELRDDRINVNAVLPSILDTPANRSAMPGAEHDRWVRLRDLADIICFLGTNGARAVHGALIPVMGRVV